MVTVSYDLSFEKKVRKIKDRLLKLKVKNKILKIINEVYISLSAGIYKNSMISSDSVSVNYMFMRDCRKNDQNETS